MTGVQTCALPICNAVLNFPEGETVTLKGVSPESIEKVGGIAKMGVPCFTSGTRLAVPGGWRAVEDLGWGDLVLTPAGAVPVIWHGMRALDAAALEEHAEQRPIRLSAGHHGLTRDLIVSPQHAVALGGALIRARHLAEWGKGAHVAKGIRQVTYHHLLLPRHALVRAEGAWAESFYPGVEALRMLAPSGRAAVTRAILGLRRDGGDGDLAGIYGPRCLPLLTGRAAREWLANGVIAALNRPGFTGGQNSRRIARYGTQTKEDLEAIFTR